MATQAVLCLINERRAHAGWSLQENASLDHSAQGTRCAMAKHKSYSHGNAASPDPRTGYLAGASVMVDRREHRLGAQSATGSPKRIVAELDAQPGAPPRSARRLPRHRGGHDKGAPFAHFGHNTATYTVDLGYAQLISTNFSQR